MRISISNIAWDAQEDEAVAALLRKHHVDAIDIALGKYFADPTLVDSDAARNLRVRWHARGIEIVGMQSLLFGSPGGLNLFGPFSSREAMLGRLTTVCRIAGELGAKRLVFGSPANRDRGSLNNKDAGEIAASFFSRLGNVAAAEGLIVCIEANPVRYGCNFMTDTVEAARVVLLTNHPAIRLQLDTGTMAVNREPATETVFRFEQLIAHVHVSEPDLVTIGDGGTPHSEIGSVVRRCVRNCVAAVEMRATQTEPHLSAIERALRIAIDCYGNA